MVTRTTVFRSLCLSDVLVFPAAIAGAQDAKSEQYASLLAQIADKKVALMQQELFAANQQKEIEFLRGQIAGVNEIKGDVDGVIEKMVAQMERAVTADLPFQREERLNRIAKLRNDLDDDSLKVGDKYRLALSALKIEVNYGMSVEDYDGERPLNDGETVGELRFALAHLDDDGVPKENPLTLKPYEESREQGTFLRYGRVALVYMDDRMVSARRWDQPEGKWIDVSGAELLDIRKAIRVARGEVAPAVVMAPTHITQ